MANVLTAAEAATVLRTEADDQNMVMLLPMLDGYLLGATGHNWAADEPVRNEAKAAARMLLVMWYENPAMVASGLAALNHGLMAALTQLEALALRYKSFEGRNGAGFIPLSGVAEGDTVSSVVLLSDLSDASALFETWISEEGYIQQISTDDLDDQWYQAYVVPMGGTA